MALGMMEGHTEAPAAHPPGARLDRSPSNQVELRGKLAPAETGTTNLLFSQLGHTWSVWAQPQLARIVSVQGCLS